MTVSDGGDGVFGIPPREPPTVTAHSSIRSRKAEDGQGVSPALRESRGKRTVSIQSESPEGSWLLGILIPFLIPY
ncbi:hypothetical protein AALC25_20250 [Lachnospiraceae bacterium 29-84]